MLALPLGPDGLPAGWPEDYGLSSLGWDILDWGHAHLAQPDGDEAGTPWTWRRWQIRYVVWWYTVDKLGSFLWDRGQVVLIKGGGKSPTAAALGSTALGGPVVFDGFDAAGNAVGKPKPSPWVQLAAVSEDQTVNTMALVLAMLREGDAADVIQGLDLGLTRIYTANGRLEPVTASAPSREGQRLTDAILDETHLWLPGNGGVRLAATIRRNLGKMRGRSIETTNAWRDGEDSVAESTARYADMAQEGRTRRARVLRMHPRSNVPDLADETTLRAGLVELYADMPWIDVDRIISEIYDPNTDPGDARRFYLNEITSADDAFFTAAQYDSCEAEDQLADDDRITLGFDGGSTDDATALIACRMHDRLMTPLDLGEGLVSIWESPGRNSGWRVDAEQVNEAVARAFDRYRVVGFYADVALWESYIDSWSSKHRRSLRVKASPNSAIGWDMRSRLQIATRGTERLVAAVRDGQFLHTGEPTMRRHFLNARKRPNRYGMSFGKESRESPLKVDAFAGAQLADMARHDLIEKGYNPSNRPRARAIVM